MIKSDQSLIQRLYIAFYIKKNIINSHVTFSNDIYEALEGSDAFLLKTECKQFRMPDWNKIKELMKSLVIVDGHNIYDRKDVESRGFIYVAIGR